MNTDDELNELISAARQAPAPLQGRDGLGFETRLLAHLREERESRPALLVWKMAPFFAAVMLTLTAVAALSPGGSAFSPRSLADLALEPDPLTLYLTAP